MQIMNFNLRNIPLEVMSKLKHEAKRNQLSVNTFILKLISNNLGFASQTKKILHHDLDHLAGTWTKKDADVFSKNIADFEKIDKDMWT